MRSDPSDYFLELFTDTTASLQGTEVLLGGFEAEDSDFVRFNQSVVRQAGSVSQRSLSLDLIDGDRHATTTIQVSGVSDQDRARTRTTIEELRDQVMVSPPDPYLLCATDSPSTVAVASNELPAAEHAIDRVCTDAAGQDLVGIYAAGDQYRGFANSFGQQNWFSSRTFNLDWSLYLHGDKATKNLYADTTWDDDTFAHKLDWSSAQLEALGRTPLELAPGGYRTFLAPAAVDELAQMLSWDGFGLKAQRTKQSPLLRMFTEGATFDPAVTMAEDLTGGTSPRFNQQGFPKPDIVPLITDGVYADSLVSPRSAQEYGVETNGASSWEAPAALHISAGALAADDALAALDTGLFVGNLWYLNYSDRAACRTTGMTRFATFWVEGGEIVAPVTALRFDDTCFRLLGENLEALTDHSELVLDPSTYGQRSVDSTRVPGALISELTITL